MIMHDDIISAVEKWISDYAHSAGAQGVVVGLSGGIDSAVTAALAASVLGRENVLALLMPCLSMEEDTIDGRRIAEHLGIQYKVINLDGVLEECIESGGFDESDILNIANIKSRIRMLMLYAHSQNRLVLGTSNLSEMAVGYWTKWGDGAADFLPIGQFYKDEVNELALRLGLPAWMIEKVPSAGLWEGQSDEQEMGVTYSQIRSYLEGGDVDKPAADTIEKMIETSRHKREPIAVFKAREWIENHD